jgi:type I restriction-modification system DNA methylase subunit
MGKSLVSNPPYNLKWDIPLFAQIQPRFSDFNVPPASNANFAFVLTGLDFIDDKMAILLPNAVLTTNVTEEKKIRKALVEQNLLAAVILLPDKMFESTSIPTCILLFDKHKKTRNVEMIDMRQTYLEEQRDQNGQFGGASHENRTYHKTVKVIDDASMNKAIDAILEKKNIPKFSKSASIDEIRNADYVLTPSRYIEFQERKTEHRAYKDIANDYNKIIREKNSLKLTVNKSLAKSLGLYETFLMMQREDGITDSFQLVGCKAEKESFITMSKNATEFKIENKCKDKLPEILLIFLSMWKQHIMYLNNEENKVLAEFRDALLPDLMSGKIEPQESEE